MLKLHCARAKNDYTMRSTQELLEHGTGVFHPTYFIATDGLLPCYRSTLEDSSKAPHYRKFLLPSMLTTWVASNPLSSTA